MFLREGGNHSYQDGQIPSTVGPRHAAKTVVLATEIKSRAGMEIAFCFARKGFLGSTDNSNAGVDMEGENRSNVRRGRKPSIAPHTKTNPCDTPEGDIANSDASSLDQLTSQLGELREYSAHFVRAKIDRFKLSVRRAATFSLLIVLATFAAF